MSVHPGPPTSLATSTSLAGVLLVVTMAVSAAPARAADDGVWSELPAPERRGHAAIVDPIGERLVVFGGMREMLRTSSVWALPLAGAPQWAALVAAGGPAPREAHTAIYDAANHRMVVFGGRTDASTWTNDVWALSLDDPPAWTPLLPSGTPPEARQGHTAIYDAPGQRMIVFGGAADAGLRSDVWELSLGAAPAWTLLTPAPGPLARFEHSAIFDPTRRRMVIYGGYPGSGTLDDAWALSLDGPPVWSLLSPAGSPPGGLSYHTAVYDAAADRMIVVGNDVEAYAHALSFGGAPQWGTIGPPLGPIRRDQHVAVVDPPRSRMLIHGGSTTGPGNDTRALSLGGTPSWSVVTPVGGAPVGRSGHATAIDPVADRMVVVGGDTGGFVEGLGTWTMVLDTTAAWAFAGTQTPGERDGASATWDPRRERVIKFGGGVGSSKTNQVWAFSRDLVWTRLFPQGTPPAGRSWHSAVYDPLGDRLLVHGGEDATNLTRDDLWELSLSGSPAWTPLAPPGSPPARRGHAAVFDARRNRMLVLGGVNAGGSALFDAWALDLPGAGAWSALNATGAPPELAFRSAVIDPVRDRVIAFAEGGAERAAVHALSLAGVPAWGALSPSGEVPIERARGAAVYDPMRDRVLVFGGEPPASRPTVWSLAFGDAAEEKPAPTCGADAIWVAGSVVHVEHGVANPFAFADTVDYVVSGERDWPDMPIRGAVVVPAGSALTIDTAIPVPDTAAAGLNLIRFDAWLRATGWPFRCTRHLHDATTSAVLSLASAHAGPEGVRLEWIGSLDAGREAAVDRAADEAAWSRVAAVTSDAAGRFVYEDRDVVPGRRYGYRLILGPEPAESQGEVWIDVPARRFTLEGVRPNPANGTALISFSTPDDEPAELAMYDLAGRRVFSRRVEGLRMGAHLMPVDVRGLAPGLYLLRLRHAGESLQARVVVVR